MHWKRGSYLPRHIEPGAQTEEIIGCVMVIAGDFHLRVELGPGRVVHAGPEGRTGQVDGHFRGAHRT